MAGLISFARTFAAVGAALLLTANSALACNPPPIYGGANHKWDGGKEKWSQAPYPEDASSTIGYSNPTPTFTNTTAWVSLENNYAYTNGCCIAQVGYWKVDSQETAPVMFVQYTLKDGSYANPTFYGTAPSGNQHYEVFRGISCLGCADGFEYYYPAGHVNITATNWGSDGIGFFGEIADYGALSGSQPSGSASIGTINSPNYFLGYYTNQNGQTYSPSLTYWCGVAQTCGVSANSTWYQNLYAWSGHEFEIWDQRC